MHESTCKIWLDGINTGTHNYNPIKAEYYSMISPPINNQDIIFQTQDIQPPITVSFFINIIGFAYTDTVADHSDIIYYGSNAKLRYMHSKDELQLVYNFATSLKYMVKLSNFSNHFGHYVHIAISYAYNVAKSFYPPMLSFSVDGKLFPIISGSNGVLISSLTNLDVTNIKISREVFARWTRLELFNKYIIAPFSYIINKYWIDNPYGLSNFIPDLKLIRNNSIKCIDYSKTTNFSLNNSKNIVCDPSFDDYFNSLRPHQSDKDLKKFTRKILPEYNTYDTGTPSEDCSAGNTDFTKDACLETCYNDGTNKICSCTSISQNYWLKKQDNYNSCKSKFIFIMFRA